MNEKAKILNETIGLLNCMILCGEKHTDTSREMVAKALALLREPEKPVCKPDKAEFVKDAKEALEQVEEMLKEERTCHDDCMCNICIAKQQTWEAQEALTRIESQLEVKDGQG